MPRHFHPQERKLFELLREERELLQGFLNRPPKGPKRLGQLEVLIFTITKRVAPFYKEGQGMAAPDLVLIDQATELLSGLEDAMDAAKQRAYRARMNCNLMYTGAGAVQHPEE
jgi:hypothetical protein